MSKRVIVCCAAVILILLILWIIWGNSALECNTFTVSSKSLPPEFSGFRIAQVSDLHNAQMGKNNERLLTMLKEAQPDMIAVTGDLIDSRRTDVAVALDFAAEAVKIAPCYYVTGNHEARISEYDDLREGLITLGVTVLEDACVEIERNGQFISLIGVNDPSFEVDYLTGDSAGVMTDKLEGLVNRETFTLLLSHRPELFETYVQQGVSLVLSGHAHGGQFRLPFIGGLAAPNQGLFPAYDSGDYTQENTTMIVSRGIGNSIIPFRINNRPELVLIELTSA